MDKELEHLRLLQRLIETRIKDLENNRVAGYMHEHRWYLALTSGHVVEELTKYGLGVVSNQKHS